MSCWGKYADTQCFKRQQRKSPDAMDVDAVIQRKRGVQGMHTGHTTEGNGHGYRHAADQDRTNNGALHGTTKRNTEKTAVMAVIWNNGIGPRQDIQKQMESKVLIMVKECVRQQHP